MVEGRRYGGSSRGRSPSARRPLPRSRDFDPSRHRKYSPYRHRRVTEDYSREAQTFRRIEKKDNLDRDFNLRAPRFSEYDSRGRDRYVVGGRQSRSPRRIEKRDDFDRDVGMRSARLSDYEDGGKGKYIDEAGHSGRSYALDPYPRDPVSTKFQWDHHLDANRKPDHLSMKDYSHTRDYKEDVYTNIPSGGGERDYYPYSRYSDSGRAGLLSVSHYLDSTKPVSQECERGGRMNSHSYTLTHGGVNDLSLRNLSGGDDSSHMPSVASRYLNADTDKQGYFNFRDQLHSEKRDGGLHDQEDLYFEKKNDGLHSQDGVLGVEKTVGRETYKFNKEENLLPSRDYMKGDSDYMVSSSQPKDYVSMSSGIVREGFPSYSASGDLHMPSNAIRTGSGLASQPIGFDEYDEKRQDVFPRRPGAEFDDSRSNSRLYIGLPQEKQGDELYAEFGRGKIDKMNARLNDVEEEYRGPRMSRIDALNPTVDESRNHMMNDGLWERYPFPRAQSTLDKFGESRSLHARKQDLDMLGAGSSRLNYGIEGYYGYGIVKPEEHRMEGAGDRWSHLERSDILQSKDYDLSFGRIYGSPSKRLASAVLIEPSERWLKQKYDGDKMLYEHDVGIRISTDGNGVRKIYNQAEVGDEIDLRKLSKRPKPSKSNYGKTWRASRNVAIDQPSSSKFNPSLRTHNSDSRDIKKRLGPVPRKLHVSQRLVKKYNPSVKKRLAPAPPTKRATLPWLKTRSSNQMVSIQDGPEGSPHNHDGNHLGDHITLAKPEPPEKSEDFKQLVQSAFFKFLKLINETPTKRKKYMEKGKVGGLKCIVCGSDSDEFIDTESLATHAFTSKKVGLRSQHLGLHKALCALMGWKITEEPSCEWHCEVMPDAETLALKEDLIIWPPVVIVHNSTIDKKNPDERVIVSTEKLDMKLRDMGFGSILKVCNGKPTNQSVMLVKFNGTLSGLQEAVRFHKSYVESKRGRAELEQLTSSRGGTQVMSADDSEENILYGHLGIAEDLDILDFDTKKRCVLRSKKEILSIVDAPSDTADG